MVFCISCACCGCVELDCELCAHRSQPNFTQPQQAQLMQNTICSYTQSCSPEDGHNDARNMLDRSLIINTRLVASCWFLFLHPTGMKYFFSSQPSRLDLRPNQPPTQWTAGLFTWGVGERRQKRKSDPSPPSKVEVKNERNHAL